MAPIVYVGIALIAALFVAGTTYAATTESGANDPSNEPVNDSYVAGGVEYDPGAGNFDDYNPVDTSFLGALIGAVGQGVTAIVNLGHSEKITRFANAIAYAEGWGAPGAIPTISNDPGDLSKGDFGDTGVYVRAGDGEQVIKFPSAQAGFEALYAKLENIRSGNSRVYNLSMSILQMGNKYAGNGSIWSKNVVAYLNQQGINATQQTTLAEVLV